LHRFLSMRRPNLNACSCTARVLVVIGQVLLIFTALSLCTMPVTQHLWTWDHFLHGGRDFELGMLMVLSLLSLVLVLAKSCKQCIQALLSARHSLASAFRDPVSQEKTRLGASSTFPVALMTCRHSGLGNPPLQV
jgi:hypothetical protein